MQDLQRALAQDADVMDRTGITKWLMQFSANLPLKLHHPRIGDIHYEGIGFQGSPATVFDRFVLLSIEDLVERHVHAVEAAMTDVPTPELQPVADQASGLIAAKRTRLLNRAATVKGTLLRSGLSAVQTAQLAGGETIPIRQRLTARVRELERQREPAPGDRPLWQPLERFVKANPALIGVIGFVLSNITSFVLGVVGTLALARIKH